jgi:hypothetical protein
LIHDLLAGVVEKSRLTHEAFAQAERLRLEQAAQRHKQKITAAVACALAVTLIATVGLGYYYFFYVHKDYYLGFEKKEGFPVGIGPIRKCEARKLPVSFRLVHVGIELDGWKLWKSHWKRPFRVEAVNGYLELTTYHSVDTYLWSKGESKYEDSGDEFWDRAQQLGLQNICQWEFISTEKGKILYERGLDRDGRMVYGLIYLPRGKESVPTRLARYVGPDGFPQFQRRSAAEYVEIHYDKEGWEDQVMYRDRTNSPAVGPNGAFGRRMSHDVGGQLTLGLSLDADGHTMIDDDGNCGMEVHYDEKGRITEQQSLGPKGERMRFKDGVVIYKNENDKHGRAPYRPTTASMANRSWLRMAATDGRRSTTNAATKLR